MKKFLFTILILFVGLIAEAQTTTLTFTVDGNCGMCKETIEKAALDAHAEKAIWNKKTKKIKVKFDQLKTTEEKIKKNIANAGYSVDNFKANENAYNNLPNCCKYKDKKNKTH